MDCYTREPVRGPEIFFPGEVGPIEFMFTAGYCREKTPGPLNDGSVGATSNRCRDQSQLRDVLWAKDLGE